MEIFNWRILGTFSVIGLVVIIGLGAHGYYCVNLMYDFQLVSKMVNGDGPTLPEPQPAPGSKKRPEPKYTPDFIKGITAPEISGFSVNDFHSTPFHPALFGRDNAVEKLQEYFAKIENGQPVIDELVARTQKVMENLPAVGSSPEYMDLGAPIPNYRLVRETARFWEVLINHGPQPWNPEKVYWSFLGGLCFSHLLAVTEADISGVTMISHMIACAVRGISSGGLLEAAPRLGFKKPQAVRALEHLETLESKAISIFRPIESELSLLPGVGKTLQAAIESGEAKKRFGRNPSYLASVLTNRALYDQVYGPYIEIMKRARNLPFPQANAEFQKISPLIEEISEKTTTFGVHSLGYLFRPARYVMELMFAISTPNMKKAYEQDRISWNRPRGVMVAIAVFAYKEENGAFPASLAELEKWLGRALPRDLFTEKPFDYKGGAEPKLTSPGPDLVPGNKDDILLLPVQIPES